MAWQSMPKTELHLHLEGAAPPNFIRALAESRGIDTSNILDDAGYVWLDFADFLDVYMEVCRILQGPEDFRELTKAVLENLHAQGVVYAEIILSPDICGDGDAGAWREHLAAIEAGADAAPEVETRFMVTVIRNFGAERAEKIARLAAATRAGRLTGFNMAGEERVFHPSDFTRAFDIARDAGFQLTCHAGEFGGADSVRAALDNLKPHRIGHGVRAVEDPALVARLADAGTLLEVCPGSNVATGVARSVREHPIALLRGAGVRVSISTDDPPYFATTLNAEYDALARAFGWTPAVFQEMNLHAMDAAFCDDTTRQRIKTILKEHR